MRLFSYLNRLLEIFLVLLLVFMVTTVFGNVILRYLFQSGIAAIEEISRYAFVWSTFIGGVILLRQNGHLAFDALLRQLGRKYQIICMIISQIIIILIAVILTKGGWDQVIANIDKTAQSSGFPMEWFYIIGPITGVLMALISIEQLYRICSNQHTPFIQTSQYETH